MLLLLLHVGLVRLHHLLLLSLVLWSRTARTEARKHGSAAHARARRSLLLLLHVRGIAVGRRLLSLHDWDALHGALG